MLKTLYMLLLMFSHMVYTPICTIIYEARLASYTRRYTLEAAKGEKEDRGTLSQFIM